MADSGTRAKYAARASSAKGSDAAPDCTTPSRKTTSPASPPSLRAANAARRARSVRAASRAAMPLRSVPDEAAVGDAFGTLLVSEAVTRIASSGSPSSRATTCRTLVNRPWPISVPPWFSVTVPSL